MPKKDAESSVPHMNSAKCLFLFLKINIIDKIGLGESEFKRAEFDEEVRRIFCGRDNQTSNHEDASFLG